MTAAEAVRLRLGTSVSVFAASARYVYLENTRGNWKRRAVIGKCARYLENRSLFGRKPDVFSK